MNPAKLIYRLFKWSITPTNTEVSVMRWFYESYFDWSEPLPPSVPQEVTPPRHSGR